MDAKIWLLFLLFGMIIAGSSLADLRQLQRRLHNTRRRRGRERALS